MADMTNNLYVHAFDNDVAFVDGAIYAPDDSRVLLPSVALLAVFRLWLAS